MDKGFLSVQAAVREFVLREFLRDGDAGQLRNDTELVKTGIVDSINVLGLVEFIEDEYAIELEPSDIQKFTTIDNIANGILGKLTGLSR